MVLGSELNSVSLTSANASAVVECVGGRLASLVIGGHELLVTEGAKPTRWGSFPMVPWCGRLDHGTLEFEAETYHFPITSPPHANHGVSHTQVWDLLSSDSSVASIETTLGDPWPFGGKVGQRFELTDTALVVEIFVEAGDRPMPAMAGWHPWFRRQLDNGDQATLVARPKSRYEVDEHMIPTGKLVSVEPGPWNECFVGLEQPPSISWGESIAATIESTFDHWVIFTEPEHALCVEPQSGPPNHLNRDPLVLQPGQTLTGSMTIAWTVR